MWGKFLAFFSLARNENPRRCGENKERRKAKKKDPHPVLLSKRSLVRFFHSRKKKKMVKEIKGSWKMEIGNWVVTCEGGMKKGNIELGRRREMRR